jgi:hypothetical protein
VLYANGEATDSLSRVHAQGSTTNGLDVKVFSPAAIVERPRTVFNDLPKGSGLFHVSRHLFSRKRFTRSLYETSIISGT